MSRFCLNFALFGVGLLASTVASVILIETLK
jgi:hypothetical protein